MSTCPKSWQHCHVWLVIVVWQKKHLRDVKISPNAWQYSERLDETQIPELVPSRSSVYCLYFVFKITTNDSWHGSITATTRLPRSHSTNKLNHFYLVCDCTHAISSAIIVRTYRVDTAYLLLRQKYDLI